MDNNNYKTTETIEDIKKAKAKFMMFHKKYAVNGLWHVLWILFIFVAFSIVLTCFNNPFPEFVLSTTLPLAVLCVALAIALFALAFKAKR